MVVRRVVRRTLGLGFRGPADIGSPRSSPVKTRRDRYRSWPLTEVGVDARAGDYVPMAINGRELKARDRSHELLQAPVNQAVEWRVSATRRTASRRERSGTCRWPAKRRCCILDGVRLIASA